MKLRMFSGIESEHLTRSALYFVIAVVMLVSAIPAGILKGSDLGVLLVSVGLILFFYSLVHPWGNAKYYFIEFAILFVIFTVLQIATIIFKVEMTEGILWFTGGVCLCGFISVVVGIVIFSEGLQSLLYSAAALALFAIFIMFPQILAPDRVLRNSTFITACIFLIFQFASVAVFISLASNTGLRNLRFQIAILISGIILLLMGVWGLIAFEIKEWMFGIRIWSVLEIISSILAIYAFALAYFDEEKSE
jgi:hypothetical protein